MREYEGLSGVYILEVGLRGRIHAAEDELQGGKCGGGGGIGEGKDTR